MIHFLQRNSSYLSVEIVVSSIRFVVLEFGSNHAADEKELVDNEFGEFEIFVHVGDPVHIDEGKDEAFPGAFQVLGNSLEKGADFNSHLSIERIGFDVDVGFDFPVFNVG